MKPPCHSHRLDVLFPWITPFSVEFLGWEIAPWTLYGLVYNCQTVPGRLGFYQSEMALSLSWVNLGRKGIHGAAKKIDSKTMKVLRMTLHAQGHCHSCSTLECTPLPHYSHSFLSQLRLTTMRLSSAFCRSAVGSLIMVLHEPL